MLLWAKRTGFVSLVLTLGFVFLHLCQYRRYGLSPLELPLQSEFPAHSRNEFDWDTLKAHSDLKWEDCYEFHQCARLRVPLNYSEDGISAGIAIIRFPSPLRNIPSEYGGPIIFNPGGPGGSGVSLVAEIGHLLSIIVGPQFDIVSFDPRGVGYSTPQIKFFESTVEQVLWSQAFAQHINVSTDVVPRTWAHAQVLGEVAERRDNNTLMHITTDNVARDMLQIVRAHGREKIQYWGFSYGTVIGTVYASLFPNNIERLVLDGVVDFDDYFSTMWSTNLEDTDKTLQTFFDGCANAGPNGCGFYAPSAANVSSRLDKLLNSVLAQPVPVLSKSAYGVIDYSFLRQIMFASLYQPYRLFSLLAEALADLEGGDGRTLLKYMPQYNAQPDCPPKPSYGNTPDALVAILCTDGEKVRDSPQEFIAYYNALLKRSSFAELWGEIRLVCSGWQVQVPDRFKGPFGGNTSHPILLIGNTADPVTPHSSAVKTSKNFPGSVVLTQNCPGHCSITGVSLCTMMYIRQYFQDGTVPKDETVCEMDEELFPTPWSQAGRMQALHFDDLQLFEAAHAVSRSFRTQFFV